MTDFLYRLMHGKKRVKHQKLLDCTQPYSECETCKLHDWCYTSVGLTFIKKS